MPKRIIDADAMWASSKLANCRQGSIPEYAWLYGIADANGNFELTNLRELHGKAYAAIRPLFTLENLKEVLDDFTRNGLLFRWKIGAKIYGHWTGSEKAGRLPPKSQRDHYPRLPVTVPSDELQSYLDTYRHCLGMENDACLGNALLGLDGVGVRFGKGLDRVGEPANGSRPPAENLPEDAADPVPQGFAKLGITITQWRDYYEMRQRIGRPLTPGAVDRLLNDLVGLVCESPDNDAVEIVDYAIKTGSYRFVAKKENENGKRQPESFQERNIRESQEELGEVRRRAGEVLSEVEPSLPESKSGQSPRRRLH